MIFIELLRKEYKYDYFEEFLYIRGHTHGCMN